MTGKVKVLEVLPYLASFGQFRNSRLSDDSCCCPILSETIVVYWGDHGVGLPRSKRTPLDTGLRVPLIVSIPPKFRHLTPQGFNPGGATERLVGFIDLAPTMLSLAGIQPPDYLQGTAFLGPYEGPVQPYLYGFRDRMDERYDLVRSIRDERFLYLRNY